MLFKNSLKKKITLLTNAILNKEWHDEITISTNESAGILDGKQIILEFLEHNEYGCAFEHLTYIINESNIKLNTEQLIELKEIGKKLKVRETL